MNEEEWDRYVAQVEGDAMAEFFADEVHCPACGSYMSYCPGHGEIGDPDGHTIIEDHDNDDHLNCHPMAECRIEETIGDFEPDNYNW